MRRALGIIGALVFFMACVGDDPDTAPTSSSSSGGGTSQQVQCNDKRCAVGEICCLDLGALSDTSIKSAHCSTASACTTGTALICDDTADCPSGQVCCAKTNGGSVKYGPSFCNTACTGSEAQLCASPADCGGKSCSPPQPSTTPTGLKECAK